MKIFEAGLDLKKRLGAGYFGEVWSAIDKLGRDVAVKMLKQRPGESASEWAARRGSILEEGQHLQKAKHDHVVQIFSVLEEPTTGDVHLVMEFCAGGSLQTTYDVGPMRLSKLRGIVTEVCLGLDAMHGRGMIHRDIKPGNLLLDARGRAKLGDFGLVTDRILFGYASSGGYLDHLPPETHATGATSVKSDVWALGMTLYRLAHGADWYKRSPAPQFQVPAGKFASKLRWLPHIPEAWRRCVRKMMHDDTGLRYQSAGQVGAALAKLPIAPDWQCNVGPTVIGWRRRTEKRKIKVTWKKIGGSKYTWDARSEPLTTGNKRTLGSGGPMSYAASERELKQFFTENV